MNVKLNILIDLFLKRCKLGSYKPRRFFYSSTSSEIISIKNGVIKVMNKKIKIIKGLFTNELKINNWIYQECSFVRFIFSDTYRTFAEMYDGRILYEYKD